MKRHLIAVLALALLTASCNRSGPSPLLKENELLARMLVADFQSGDVSNLSSMFYPTAVYDDYSSQSAYKGLREISGYVRSIQSWADDISMSVNAVHASETGATVEWTLDAVQRRPIPGTISVATGKQVQINGVTVLEISRHLITRAADYMDDLGLLLQLGGQVHMPGGTVLKDNASPSPDTATGGR
jgi:hypothetical protein